ncbi:CGNR zinc finger domain-containing protein [Georgenia sp. SUBG003]|uniref:CGNR zinc finger domain-containing protein n=1 Tax=Georgenia sp. SUBG003 TaxID=1497974 RepID=UPI003AB4A10C
MAEPLRVLLAGGGTAGHVNPLLATAAELRAGDGAEVTVLGTEAGLERTLVPEAGYPLRIVERVPLPRRPSADLLRLPGRLAGAVRAAEAAIAESRAQAVALADVVRAGELDRLRVCAGDDCEDLVVDLSRNRSRRFCEGGCANRAHVAAYRARRADR